MQRLVFYTIVFGFASGVFLRSFLFVPLSVAACIGLVGGALLVLWYRSCVTRRALPLLACAVGLICISLGALRFMQTEQSLSASKIAIRAGETITLTGTIIKEPDTREKTTLLTMYTNDTRVLVTTERTTPIQYGDVIEVTGKLHEPERFATDYGREFDYAGYLSARGITHTMSFVTPAVVSTDGGHMLISWLYQAKAYFLKRLALVLPEPQVGLAAGLLLGVQSALGEELTTAFRTSGIIHIVVLSGYNIMLVVAFVMYVLAFVLPWRLRLVVGAVSVVIFALLVGYSPSVMRASVMALIFLAATLLARQYLIMRALFAAATIMIFINPYILHYDIGFQLSFMATLGLILVAPQFESFLTHVPAKYKLKDYFVATVATQIAVAPLIFYYIGEWSLVAVPVNLVVLPMVPVAMLLTFITGLIAMVSTTLAIPFAYAAYASLTFIIEIAKWAAAVPFATLVVPPFPGYIVPVLYGSLALIYWRIWRRQLAVKNKLHAIPLPKTGTEAAALREAVAIWEIVEEVETVNVIAKTNRTSGPTSKAVRSKELTAVEDTPIFFR